MNEDGDAPLSPLKKALLAVQTLKRKLADAEGGRREPVAVVGASRPASPGRASRLGAE